MTGRTFPLVVLATLLTIAPLSAAEFGPESPDGWPLDAHGHEILPPVAPRWTATDLLRNGGEADPVNKQAGVTIYPYYPILVAELQRLAADHPDLVKLTSAGTSTAGLDLWLLEIADFHNLDAGDGVPLEEREVIYLDGGTHSNEYSGVYFVTEIAQFLLDEYETNETAKWVVENRHIYILPMVNPDGSHVFGRMNAKWVNVNRNFPAIWNEVDENPVLNNPGPAPASEPETQAVLAVLEAIQPDYVNSIHCCGNLWLHPYGHEDFEPEPDDLEMFTRICDEVFYDVRDDCGPIWSTIYPASGTTADTGYDLHGASSWTYEMSGRGAIAPWGQPTIMDDVRVQERESWRGVIHALEHTEKYGAHPVITAIEGDDDALTVTIKNTGYQTLRAGQVAIGTHHAELPLLAPGQKGTVTVEGAFAAGDTHVHLAWQKRVKHAPWGALPMDVELVRDGGLLMAKLPGGGDALATASADEAGETIPLGPWVALAALALAGVALRRRRA